ncbi:MAG: DnaD domain protein, partial [Clostridia bacterium]|nr:DnaD domain protein [Clostridia bacterium]
ELAVKWVEDWHFSDELLRLAAAIAHESVPKSGNFTAYMDGVLRRWLAEGIDSPDKVQAAKPASKKKGPAATNPEESSLDTDEFEQALLRYRPRFGENT